jgi:hypothetical protein
VCPDPFLSIAEALCAHPRFSAYCVFKLRIRSSEDCLSPSSIRLERLFEDLFQRTSSLANSSKPLALTRTSTPLRSSRDGDSLDQRPGFEPVQHPGDAAFDDQASLGYSDRALGMD